MLETLGRLSDPPHPIDELWPLYPKKKSKFQELVLVENLISQETRNLLHSLSGFQLAVVTSSMRAEIEPILQREGVLPLFHACVYGDSVRKLKPDPEPYLLAKELLGVRSALVLEDSQAGQASGRAAGCDVLAIRNAAEVPRKLTEWLSGRVEIGL
jgi:HAD superfamily hydrolase (TIGR01509 family)